jgi:hypothetical protein
MVPKEELDIDFAEQIASAVNSGGPWLKSLPKRWPA